jgi:hypothetical protein
MTNKADQLANVLPQNQTEATLDVYEFWDKERKVTFWIAEGATVPLDVQADVCEFEGFFPTSLPLGRFDTANTMPISDYKLVQNQYRELDNLNTRAANLSRALKLRWMYDGSNKDLAELFTTTDELEGVPVDNWSMFMSDKGGLAGSVMFTPLADTVQAYQSLITSRENVKAQIYEIEGISDIARAASMPPGTQTYGLSTFTIKSDGATVGTATMQGGQLTMRLQPTQSNSVTALQGSAAPVIAWPAPSARPGLVLPPGALFIPNRDAVPVLPKIESWECTTKPGQLVGECHKVD